MITSLLEKLYTTSKTPFQLESGVPIFSKDYLINEDTVAHIGKVQNSQALQPIKVQGVTDEDIKAVILFILRLVNMQIDLDGALLIEPSIKYLLNEVLKEANIDRTDLAGKAIEIITTEWFKILKSTSAGTRAVYNHFPYYENSPFLTWHIKAQESCKLPNGTAPLYEVYAYEFHKRLRLQERVGLPKETFNACVRTVRYFFQHCSSETKQRTNLKPDEISDSVLKDFKSGYTKFRMGRNNSDAIEETADTYLDRLDKIWGEEPILPRPRFKKDYREKSDHLPPPKGTSEENTPVFSNSDYEIKEDDDGEEGWDKSEGPAPGSWDFVHKEEGVQKAITDKDPEVFDYKWHDELHLRSYQYYWENTYLGLFHYSMLYHAMQDLWNKKPQGLHRVIVIYFNFLIHTGIGSRLMLDLRGPACKKVGEDEAQLVVINKRYYLEHPSIIKLRTTPELGLCLPTAKKVRVPVPGKMVALIKQLPKDTVGSEYVFSYKENNKLKRLKPDSIFAFLKDVNKSFERYTLKITLPRIANSFQTTYHNRYGLDPIIACHISGKDRQKLFGSQLHYIHVRHNKLAREYLTVFSEVDYVIRANLTQCLQRKLVATASKITPNTREKPIISDVDNFDGYGSANIPKGDYVPNMVDKPKKAIISDTNIISRHNLYMIYVYLGIQFAAALRPRNDPDMPWTRFNARAGTILIKDKLTERFREERLLPLPTVVRTLLANLKRGFDILEDYLIRNLCFSDQRQKAENIFFFIDEEGRLGPFTLKGMRERLVAVGIEYVLPANMPRQYVRTYLYVQGIGCDLADIWMGHQHVGREALSVTSSVVFGEAVRTCMPRIETMMQEIGFSDVAYLPDHA